MSDVVFLEVIQVFDVEYVAIGKTFAKHLGVASERDIDSLFAAIEGDRSADWFYTCGGTRVEWYDRWDTLDNINFHTFFRVIPIESVPGNLLADRLARFDTMRSKPIPRSEVKGDWFKKHTQRLTGETDVEFEHRMVKTLATLFRIIQKHNPIGGTP